MKVPPPRFEGAASSPRRCRLLASKVPPPRPEGAASSPRRCRLRQSRVPRFAHGVSELAKTVSKLAKSYVESPLTIAGIKFFCTFALTFFRYHYRRN